MKGLALTTYIRIINMLATGHTCKMIAAVLGYSESTMETYIVRIRKVYGAKNTAHLIHKAHQERILK